MVLQADDSLAIAVKDAIQEGNVEELQRLLSDNPGLATAKIRDGASTRSLLHIVTDWPGHFPNGAETVGMLVSHGADVNARFEGAHSETPLHWAASTDDVAALDALLDRGADIEAPGAVIGGGTPIADAVAFGQWGAARRLIERGAQTTLWQAAALGLVDRIEAYFQSDEALSREEITKAFWCACHGGQRAAAEYLLARGPDVNWVGYDQLTPLDAASRAGATELVEWLRSQGAKPSLTRPGDPPSRL